MSTIILIYQRKQRSKDKRKLQQAGQLNEAEVKEIKTSTAYVYPKHETDTMDTWWTTLNPLLPNHTSDFGKVVEYLFLIRVS